MTWQTRTISAFIAATVPIAEGQENPLAAAAQRIGEPADADTDTAPAPSVPAGGPAAGSFERFRAAFGRALT